MPTGLGQGQAQGDLFPCVSLGPRLNVIWDDLLIVSSFHVSLNGQRLQISRQFPTFNCVALNSRSALGSENDKRIQVEIPSPKMAFALARISAGLVVDALCAVQ